jgi:hypothetical protein
MLRLVEIILFVAPFVIFAAWRIAAPAGNPPTRVLAGTAIFLLLMFVALLWLRHEGSLPAGDTYVPSELQDGRIVPAHGIPR